MKRRASRKKTKTKQPESFRELQQFWYAKLKKEGFKDIEYGIDFNKHNMSTLRSGEAKNAHISWDFSRADHDGDQALEGWDGESGIGDSAKYEFYSRIAEYAWNEVGDKGMGARKRKILLACIEQPPEKAAQMIDVPVDETKSVWQATVEKLGMANKSFIPRERAPEPAPVRTLSKSEIKRLKYTPPKAGK